MVIDLTKRTIVTGNQLDELEITKFDKFNGHDFSFKYKGVTYIGRKIKGRKFNRNGEKYHILRRVKDKKYKQNL